DGSADRHPLVRDRRPRRSRIGEGGAPRRPLPRHRGGAHRWVLPGPEQGRNLPGGVGSPGVLGSAPCATAGLLRENGVTGSPPATRGAPVAGLPSVALLAVLLLGLAAAPFVWLG